MEQSMNMQLMKSLRRSTFVTLVGLCVTMAGSAWAASGTWTDTNSNDWSNANTASWLGGIIADGAGNTADFSTIDLPTDIFVNVVDPRTIGNLIFGDMETVTTPANWNLSGSTITLAGTTPTITVSALGTGNTATIGDVIAGTAGLTKAGSGTLVLTGNNTFTGGVNISGGTFDTSFSGTVLAKQIVTLSGGGVWRFNFPGSGANSGWGLNTSGTAQPPAYNAAIGAVFVAAGQTGTLSPTGSTNFGQVGGGAGSTLNVIVPNSTTFQAMGSWATNAPGALNSGGNLGALNVSVPTAGNTGRFVLNANTSNVVNNVDRFGVNSLQNTALTLGDGITMFTRGPSGGNTITIGSLAGTSGAILAGGGQSGGSITTYSIGSLNTDTIYAGRITSENVLSFGSTAGSTNITKVGSGTLTLSGTIDFSPNTTQTIPNRRGGVTTISAGTLALRDGAVIGGGVDQTTNPTTVDIRSGAVLDVGTTGTYQSAANQQVIGPGHITGNYNLAAGLLAPANTINNPSTNNAATPISNNAVAGIMTIDNFSVHGSGIIRFDLSNSPAGANDRIDVLGGDMTGTPTLSLSFLPSPGPGTYTIINSTSAALTGSLSGWTVGFAGRGTAPTLSFSGDNKQVLLTIGAGSFGNINWQGGTDGTWDIQGVANWYNTAPAAINPDKYFDSDNVNFLDTYDGANAPSNASAITLNIAVSPSSVTVNNSLVDYSISGTGKISGGASLTKHGTGTLTLTTANDNTGGTTIDGGGTINLGSTGTLGTGAIAMNNGAIIAQTTANTNTTPVIQLVDGSSNTITLNSGTTHTLGALSGGGDLTLTSDTSGKTIDTAGTNTATGHVTVDGPIVRVGGTGGNAAAGATIQWILQGSGTIASGSGNTQALGSLEGTGGTLKGFYAGSGAVAHTWEIGALAGVGVEKVFAGTIVDGTGSSNSTAATNIVKMGEGTLTLAGNNTFRGTTVVNAGTLKLANANALQNSALTPGGAGVVFDSSVDPHAFNIGGLNGSVNLALQDNAVVPNPIALTVGGVTQNISSTYSGALSGVGASLTKNGTGTFTLSGNNTYTGPTTINAGTLRLGAADRIADVSTLVLTGGTFAANGFSETLGPLDLLGTATIDMGTGANSLHLADSHTEIWGGGLTIANWTTNRHLFVGSNATGLDAGQLSAITFNGFNSGALITGAGELLPGSSAIVIPGDFNRDGAVTATDVTAMLQAMTDLSAYQTTYFLTADDVKTIGDLNFDTVVTNADIQPLLDLLGGTGSGSIASVPEPPAGFLAALGLVGLALFRRRSNAVG